MRTARIMTTWLLVLGFCGLAGAESGPVRFMGTVTADEQHEVVPVCYGSYFVEVKVDETLTDDDGLLAGVTRVDVCYAEGLALTSGDRVEVYGIYYKGTGACPKQYCRRVIAVEDPYYINVLPARELYVLTRSGILTVSRTGRKQMLLDAHKDSYAIEIRDKRLYVTTATRGGDIITYNLEGHHIETIPTPAQAKDYLTFVALPDKRFALLDNHNDKVFFINEAGSLLATTNIRPVRDNLAQGVDGVVVGNRLILSEDGDQRLLQIDLATYEASLFRDLSALPGPPGPIAYASGTYYICGPQAVYAFAESSDALTKVAEIPEANITGIVVVGDCAYVTVNFAGTIYKVDLTSGVVSELASGLDYPLDIETVLETGCFEVCMSAEELPVPDQDTACWVFREPWFTSLPPKPTWAPENAIVTSMRYKLILQGALARCGDYEIWLDNDPCESDPGLLVYDNLGGLTDGGHDDDPADDRDIELDWRQTHAFDGQSVHQDWTACFTDTLWGYSGRVTELCLRICWEVEQTAAACCGFNPGDRVVLLIDNPRGAAGLFTGAEGIVICCDSDDPLLPIFVSWDGWTNGRDTDQHCDAAPLPYPRDSGWWVACADIGPAGPGDNGGCMADLEAYQPMTWGFTPDIVNICTSTARVDLTYGLRNAGCTDSGDFRACFYASKDLTIDSSDTLLYDIPHASLAPGETGLWQLWMNLGPGELAPGKYYLGCVIDCDGRVEERNESNNVMVIDDQELTVQSCP